MGRYYDGNISGKFWFAVQSSSDGEFFGMEEAVETPSPTRYYTEDLDAAQAGVAMCIKKLGDKRQRLDVFFKEHDSYNDDMLLAAGFGEDELHSVIEWYARLDLGAKIVEAIKRDGYCEYEAEV